MSFMASDADAKIATIDPIRALCTIGDDEFVLALEAYDMCLLNRQSVVGSVVDQMVRELFSMHKLFASVGMQRIKTVFDIVKELKVLNTTTVHGWRVCALSGTQTQQSMHVLDDVFVCKDYEAWIRAVWLVTHIQFLEQQRLATMNVENTHAISLQEQSKEAAMVYAKAVRLVYESFQDAYATLKKSTRLL